MASPTWADFTAQVGAGATVKDFLPAEARAALFPSSQSQGAAVSDDVAALPPTSQLFQNTPSGEPLRLSWMRLNYMDDIDETERFLFSKPVLPLSEILPLSIVGAMDSDGSTDSPALLAADATFSLELPALAAEIASCVGGVSTGCDTLRRAASLSREQWGVCFRESDALARMDGADLLKLLQCCNFSSGLADHCFSLLPSLVVATVRSAVCQDQELPSLPLRTALPCDLARLVRQIFAHGTVANIAPQTFLPRLRKMNLRETAQGIELELAVAAAYWERRTSASGLRCITPGTATPPRSQYYAL